MSDSYIIEVSSQAAGIVVELVDVQVVEPPQQFVVFQTPPPTVAA